VVGFTETTRERVEGENFWHKRDELNVNWHEIFFALAGARSVNKRKTMCETNYRVGKNNWRPLWDPGKTDS